MQSVDFEPVKFSREFIQTPLGGKLNLFVQDISSLPSDPFPLSPVISARVLNFGEERYGINFIKRLRQAGVFTFGDAQTLTKEELIVAKLAQEQLIEGPKVMRELCDLLTEALRKTRLEKFVGRVKPEFAGSVISAKVLEPNEDENGHWWIDTRAITFNRRDPLFYVHH